jgi:hypothetical protein
MGDLIVIMICIIVLARLVWTEIISLGSRWDIKDIISSHDPLMLLPRLTIVNGRFDCDHDLHHRPGESALNRNHFPCHRDLEMGHLPASVFGVNHLACCHDRGLSRREIFLVAIA